jgi:selenide,water dikinase
MALEILRLTQRAAGGGCACKVPAEQLSELLQGVPRSAVPDGRFLVGNDTLDDAAVVRLGDDQAIVQTVDVFTPIVDDPYDFGRIAATNAISDVFAMGGEPLFALAIGGFPADLPPAEVSAILRGGAEVAIAAGAPILGGHTITAAEPLYGLAVTGLVHPDRIWRNAGARIGDVLVLTKALGTGIVANALRKGAVGDDVLAAAVASMTTLNRTAAAALREVGPHAVTDVTGFGLLGHLRELCAASGVHARVRADALPLLRGVEDMARAGLVPGGSQRNRRAADAYAAIGPDVDPVLALLACDAQTSGGLLAAVPPSGASIPGTVIGEIVAGPPGRITLV